MTQPEPGLYFTDDDDGEPMLFLLVSVVRPDRVVLNDWWVMGMRTSIHPEYTDNAPQMWRFNTKRWRRL